MTLRSSLPLAVVLVLYAAIVPNVISFLQSSTNLPLSTLIAALTGWWTVGLLRYLYHTTTLQLPGPVPFPLIGNCLDLVKQGNLQESVGSLIATHGKAVDLLLLNGQRAVLVNDAAFCRAACKSTDRGDLPDSPDWKKSWRERFIWRELWGLKGIPLFSRTGDKMDWAGHRKFLQPAFDQKRIRAMAVKIETAVDTMVEGLETGNTIDILTVFQAFGLDMIHLTSFGASVNSLPDRGRFLVDILNNSMKLHSAYMFDPFLFLTAKVLPALGFNQAELQRRKDIPVLRQYCRDLLEKELKRQEKDGADGVDNLLSIMASGLSEKFGAENLIDDLIGFVFAGYDTTAATLGNLMNHLATHPSIQEKLYEEISTVATEEVGLADAVKEMPYLAACIRESQRLQPIAPMVKRRIQDDIPIKQKDGSRVVVPKGTIAIIPGFLIHRDEGQYPDPEAFHPERWLDENNEVKRAKTGYFYAFGQGPKMCIGIQLAEREVKMAAAGILKEFRVESRGEVKIVDDFTTGPAKVLVGLSRRT